MGRETLPIFLSGAVAVVVAMFWGFHQPYGLAEVRYATPRERYWVAVSGYVAFGLIGYVVLWSLVFFLAWLLKERLVSFGVKGSSLPQFAAWVTFAVACLAALAIPAFGPTARLLASAARAAQAFGGYPSARNDLVNAMSATTFEPHQGAEEDLARELDRYGIDEGSIRMVAESAYRPLVQAVSVNLCFMRLGEPKRAYQRFLRKSRRDKWEAWQQQYRRVLRRTARALLSAEDIASLGGASDGSLARARLAISNFVVEETDELLRRGRRLLAELAMRTLPAQAVREELLKSVGYVDVSLPRPLPIAPVLIVLFLELATFWIPPALTLFGFNIFPSPLSWKAILAFSLARAICQAVAIMFALYPKWGSSFARPSLRALPWPSYVVFSAASFVGTAILFFLLFNTLPPRGEPRPLPVQIGMALANGIFFLVTTVVVSILVDRRLRRRALDDSEGRIADALVCGVAGAASMAAFGLIAFLIGPPPNTSPT